MAYEKCLEILRQAAPKLADNDFEFILSSLQRKAAFYEKRGMSSNADAAFELASNEFANDIKMAAIIERRNAALNIGKRLKRIEWAKETFGTKVYESLKTILVGSNRLKEGARDGVMQMQTLLLKRYSSGLTSDLVRSDLQGLWASGTMDRQVWHALYAIGREDEAALHAKLPKEAVEIARIVDKYQEIARLDANREGAWIGKTESYVTHRSHDPYRITTRGGVNGAEWKADALKWFDTEELLVNADSADLNATLHAIYIDLAAGNHLKAIPDAAGGFTGTRNLAKKLSQERVITFTDADAAFEYNQKYGYGNLRESVMSGLRHSAESTGLMQVLGTNPRDMIKRIEDALVLNAKAQSDTSFAEDLRAGSKRLGYWMDAVDGSMNSPGSHVMARRVSNVLGWEVITKLGTMLASQLNDTALYGAAARHDGRGFLSAMGESIKGLAKDIKAKERFDFYSSLDVAIDSMVGEIGRTGSFHDPGGMTKAVQTFMKWNLSQWWTDRLKTSAQTGLSHYLGLQKSKSFAALEPDLQNKLSIYGINADKWEMIRAMPQEVFEGKEFVTAEGVKSLPDSAFHKGLADAGLKINEHNISTARREFENQIRNYFVDRSSFYVIDTDAKTRAVMLAGTKPGTWEGSFARMIMQFKGFTGAYMDKSLGQELFGRGYDGNSVMGALKAGNGEFRGLAALLSTTTLLGYASLTLKDLMKNKTPRDVTDPEIAWKVFLASMVQGGGAGLYGDFLFGDSSRMGSGTVESLVGPAISDVGRIADLYHKAIRGDDAAARGVNTMMNMLPLNILGSRTALDYLFIHDIQERMNPGYLSRTERRMEKDYGQEFLVRPH